MKEQENMKEFIVVYQGTTAHYCETYMQYHVIKAIDLKDARRVFRKQLTTPNSIRILAIGELLWKGRKTY